MKTVYLKVKIPDDGVVTSVEYSPKDNMEFVGLYTTDFTVQDEVEEKEVKIEPLKSWKSLGKRKRY